MQSDILNEILSCFGPSGREGKISELIRLKAEGKASEIFTDALGNLVIRKKGQGKKIMIAAHMDQIGFIITHIDEKGFLRFAQVGYHSPVYIFGQRVVFENGVQGIIGHDEIKNISELNMTKLYIDIGAESYEDALKYVSVGDMCIINTPYYENETSIMSRALDDRIGCYIMLETILNSENHNDCYFVFTTQEEVGLRGAKVSSFNVDPEYCIAIDVTRTGDTYQGTKMNVKLGGGAAIKLMDQGMITNPEVKKLMVDVANKENIKYQFEVLEAGTTDATAAQLTRSGIKSGCISVPTRWIHTGSELIKKSDLDECIKLLKGIVNYVF